MPRPPTPTPRRQQQHNNDSKSSSSRIRTRSRSLSKEDDIIVPSTTLIASPLSTTSTTRSRTRSRSLSKEDNNVILPSPALTSSPAPPPSSATTHVNNRKSSHSIGTSTATTTSTPIRNGRSTNDDSNDKTNIYVNNKSNNHNINNKVSLSSPLQHLAPSSSRSSSAKKKDKEEEKTKKRGEAAVAVVAVVAAAADMSKTYNTNSKEKSSIVNDDDDNTNKDNNNNDINKEICHDNNEEKKKEKKTQQQQHDDDHEEMMKEQKKNKKNKKKNKKKKKKVDDNEYNHKRQKRSSSRHETHDENYDDDDDEEKMNDTNNINTQPPSLGLFVHHIRSNEEHLYDTPSPIVCISSMKLLLSQQQKLEDEEDIIMTEEDMNNNNNDIDNNNGDDTNNNKDIVVMVAISYESGMIVCKDANDHGKLRTIAVVPGSYMPFISSSSSSTSDDDHDDDNKNHSSLLRRRNKGNNNNNATSMTNMVWFTGTTGTSTAGSNSMLIGSTPAGYICRIHFGLGICTNITYCHGGIIYCMIQCNKIQQQHKQKATNNYHNNNRVAIGCEDGIIRILSIIHDTTTTTTNNDINQPFDVIETLPSTGGSSVLSLAYHHHHYSSNNDNSNNETMFAGCSDGTIRRYDRQSSTNSRNNNSIWTCTIRITMECYGMNIPTKVWVMKIISDDFTLITGDSLGHIQIWDGYTCTLQQTILQNDVHADILTIDINYNENTIYASGIYPRVICIEKRKKTIMPTQQQQQLKHRQVKQVTQWILTNAHNAHSHDIVSLCVVPYYTQTSASNSIKVHKEILLSGGYDTKLCLYSIQDFSRTRPKVIYPYPTYTSNHPYVSVTRNNTKTLSNDNHCQNNGRYMSVLYTNHHQPVIHIYQLAPKISTIRHPIQQQRHSRSNNKNKNHYKNDIVRSFLWKRQQQQHDNNDNDDPSSHGQVLVCTIHPNDEKPATTVGSLLHYNVLCTALSPNGCYYAYTNTYELYLFYISYDHNNKGGIMPSSSSQRIYIPDDISYEMMLSNTNNNNNKTMITTITSLSFIQSNTLAIGTASYQLDNDGIGTKQHYKIHIISLNIVNHHQNTKKKNVKDESSKNNRVDVVKMKLQQTIVESSSSSYTSKHDVEDRTNDPMILSSSSPIHTIQSTMDGNWFYTMRHHYPIHIYRCVTSDTNVDEQDNDNINKDKSYNQYQLYWMVPTLKYMISTASFFYINQNNLHIAIACMNYRIYTFDVTNRCMTPWNYEEQVSLLLQQQDDDNINNNNENNNTMETIKKRKYNNNNNNMKKMIMASSLSNLQKHYPYDYPLRIMINRCRPNQLLVGSMGSIISMDMNESYPLHYRCWPTNHVRSFRSSSVFGSKSSLMANHNSKTLSVLHNDNKKSKSEGHLNNKKSHDDNMEVNIDVEPSFHDDEDDGSSNEKNSTNINDEKGIPASSIIKFSNNSTNIALTCRHKSTTPSTSTVMLPYNNMLYTNFIDDNEIIVLEQSWMDVLPTLPQALERKIYGAY